MPLYNSKILIVPKLYELQMTNMWNGLLSFFDFLYNEPEQNGRGFQTMNKRIEGNYP